MPFQYNDPILITWRLGTVDDPYIPRTDTKKIINNEIVLFEIPDKFSHVTVDGYTEVYDAQEISTTNFKVNYQNSIVTFNPSEEGKTITASYMGKGIIQYPAEKIYFHGENPDIVENLQEITERGIIAIEAMEQAGDFQIKTTTEDLLAGDFVNIYNNSGTVSVRKANATDSTKPAHGFILENVSSGGDIAVYFEGINDKFTGLTVGTKYYLNTVAGQIISTIPSTSNNILQYLGDAINSTSIFFTKRDYVLLV